MKLYHLLIALCIAASTAAQTDYDAAMTQLASGLTQRIETAGSGNVLIGSFKRLEGRTCDMASTLTIDLETALTSAPKKYKLLDRQNLEALAAEHKLEMNGMMDEEQRMREAGKLLKADAMIFGYYTLAGEQLVLRVKAVDIQTSEQLVVLSATCTPSALVKGLCSEPSPSATDTRSGTGSEPERPTPETATVDMNDPSCASKRTGTYCFTNKGRNDLEISATLPAPGPTGFTRDQFLLLRPGRMECYVDQPAGSHKYWINEVTPNEYNPNQKRRTLVGHGNLVFRTCTTEHMTYP